MTDFSFAGHHHGVHRYDINHNRVGHGWDDGPPRGDEKGPRWTGASCGHRQCSRRVPPPFTLLFKRCLAGGHAPTPSGPIPSPQDPEPIVRRGGLATWSPKGADPDSWVEPLEFRPERFLMDSTRKWDFRSLPFGSGRRVCAGIPIGERTVLYILASLVHSFQWQLPAGKKQARPFD